MRAETVFPATDRLARFAAALRCQGLPPAIRAQMGVLLIDFERSPRDDRVRALSRRTVCVRDPAVERATTTEYVPARVTLQLAAGGRREHAVWLPPGSPKRPLSADDIDARFRAVVSRLVAPGTDLESWLARARSPEALAGVSELMSLRSR